jgi:hypothetical protein
MDADDSGAAAAAACPSAAYTSVDWRAAWCAAAA